MKNEVFNNTIGNPYGFNYPNLTKAQKTEIVSSLFEQLVIFDSITITTNRVNFALTFLISCLGINTVERLLDTGYIKIMIWSPMIFSGTGKFIDDKTLDHSVIYGQPPIAAGRLSDEDLDPERNIEFALSNFLINKDRKRIFSKIALKNYIVPNGMEFSTGSAELILNTTTVHLN